jgi:hypothetical protein
VDERELALLAEKLRELLALRALGDADPPADRLRALAARFPGALRELDRSPIENLQARLAAVTSAIAGGPLPAWAKATSRYHGWLRVALRLRREAARTESAAIAWAEAYAPVLPGDPARLDAEVLRLLIAPPDGRLVRVVCGLVASELGQTLEQLDAILLA